MQMPKQVVTARNFASCVWALAPSPKGSLVQPAARRSSPSLFFDLVSRYVSRVSISHTPGGSTLVKAIASDRCLFYLFTIFSLTSYSAALYSRCLSTNGASLRLHALALHSLSSLYLLNLKGATSLSSYRPLSLCCGAAQPTPPSLRRSSWT
jgi:hypothetical protein